jgi:hypothetical protein
MHARFRDEDALADSRKVILVNLYEDALPNFVKLRSILNEDASAHTAGKPHVLGEYSKPI